MALFGRRTARQRLRRATRQSLRIPAFTTSADCTPWVLGGLWPAELSTITPETATLAEYLNADLRRIAGSANEKLQAISRSGLAGLARQAAEARVINVARAFAVLRIESTVRQLRKEAVDFRAEYLSLNSAPPAAATAGRPPAAADEGTPADRRPRHPSHRREDAAAAEPAGPAPAPSADPEVIERQDIPADPPDLVVIEGVSEHTPASPPAGTRQSAPETVADSTGGTSRREPESDEQRLRRLLEFAARQEPGLRWAVGAGVDADTVLVTDLAHGWIPPGVELPAGVRLLEPGWHAGNAVALLGATALSATYVPGDRLGWATDSEPTEASPQPRELPAIDDLGRLLAEATHWRDGLPRLVNTLAKAGVAGTGVADAELNLLRVNLDTARYQILAQYPDVDTEVLLNCLLLAATEAIATGDRVSANYHFAWFQTLSAPPAGKRGFRPVEPSWMN